MKLESDEKGYRFSSGGHLRIVEPAAEDDPRSAPLTKGPVTVKFTAADWTWLSGVIGDARKADEIRLGESTVIREAICRLAKAGGWPELRAALLERRRIEPRQGRKKGT